MRVGSRARVLPPGARAAGAGWSREQVNPALDQLPDSKMHGDNPLIGPTSPTVQLGVELVLSALGKKIM